MRDKPAGLLACCLQRMPRSLKPTLVNAKTAPALPRSKASVSKTVDQSRLIVETIGPLGRQPEVVCQIKPHNLALRRQRSYVRIVSGAPLRFKTARAKPATPNLNRAFIRPQQSRQLDQDRALLRSRRMAPRARRQAGRSGRRAVRAKKAIATDHGPVPLCVPKTQIRT